MIALLSCVLTIRFRWFKLSTFTAAYGTFDILKLEVDDLVDNNTADTAGPEWIWGSMLHSIIGCIVGSSLLVLKFWMILQIAGESLVLAVGAECRPELGLAKESNLPVKLTRHLAALVHARKL